MTAYAVRMINSLWLLLGCTLYLTIWIKVEGRSTLILRGNEADPWEVDLPEEELEFVNDTK